jgi:ABC-type dipeptide/oligopeptide/nickel transport system permease subunit
MEYQVAEINKTHTKSRQGPWRLFWRRFWHSPGNRVALIVVALFFSVAIAGLVGILPDFQTKIGDKFASPALTSPAWWFGTDLFGRSVLYKILAGAKTSLFLGVIVALTAVFIGTTLGALAGYLGGKVDAVIQWVYSIIVVIPYIILIVAIAYVLGKGLVSVALAMGLISWVSLCRLVRGEFMRLKEREFILAAKVMGASSFRIMFRHMLPNVFHIAIISGSIELVHGIKAEVILSYLGIGVQDGSSWGQMIVDAPGELMSGIWWPALGVTSTMFILVFCLNRVGDGLRDALDPKA